MKLSDYFIQLIVLLHLSIVGLFKPEEAERARRMLFLTSLATALAKEGIIKRNALDTLNEDLQLANSDDSLKLGKQLSTNIWSHKNLKGVARNEGWDGIKSYICTTDNENGTGNKECEYLSLNDIRVVGTKVIRATPDWIKYDKSKMQADVPDLFMTHAITYS